MSLEFALRARNLSPCYGYGFAKLAHKKNRYKGFAKFSTVVVFLFGFGQRGVQQQIVDAALGIAWQVVQVFADALA